MVQHQRRGVELENNGTLEDNQHESPASERIVSEQIENRECFFLFMALTFKLGLVVPPDLSDFFLTHGEI